MHRLVYLSEAVGEFSDDRVAQMVAASRVANTRRGVTGLLLFHDGRFFQELEGPRAAVAQAFEHIRKDPRHTNVEILEFGPVKVRAFEGWALAWDHPERLPDHLRITACSIFDLMDPARIADGARPKARAKLRRFLSGFRWLRAAAEPRPYPQE